MNDGYVVSVVFELDVVMYVNDLMLLYFMFGMMLKLKFVEYMYCIYLVGYLLMMYWVGLQLGDIYWNISFLGWVKYVWSCFFVLWNVQVCVFVFNYVCFELKVVFDVFVKYCVMMLCVLLIVWCMFVQQLFVLFDVKLCEIVGVGELLNFEIIECVKKVWNILICDGYGQIEMICLIGNLLGQLVVVGLMGWLLFGYWIVLFDLDGVLVIEGEVVLLIGGDVMCLVGLMKGYVNNLDVMVYVMCDGYYCMLDIVMCCDDGYYVYIGCVDDVFKLFDYWLSLFELESVLIEYLVIVEVVVVLSLDLVWLLVLKIFIMLCQGYEESFVFVLEIFCFLCEKFVLYKCICCL